MNILEKIVQSKRDQFPASESKTETPFRLERNDNKFLSNLKRQGVQVIGEVKPRSPSAGDLLKPGQLESTLAVYKEKCAAISVLTDETFFGGSFELLAHVKRTTNLPVLCKDFIVDERQLVLASKHGADAVLLISKILSTAELSNLFNTAVKLNLVPVVEVNSESDIEKLADVPADVVLINNRNLDTMGIDLDTTGRLASRLPESTIVISASGIKSNSDVEKLYPFATRFLIGTSLMQSPAPGALLDQLLLAETRTAFPLIKICGITNSLDAELSIRNGARFLGIIFAESSKRRVSKEAAQAIKQVVGKRAKLVGVFQDQSIEFVKSTAEEFNLDLVQLHGNESPAFIEQCSRPVIKTIQYELTDGKFVLLNGSEPIENSNPFSPARYFLFDQKKNSSSLTALKPGQRLQLLSTALERFQPGKPFFIAGSLNAENVNEAIDVLTPYAIDAASGVESAPGVKSEQLIKTFCTTIQQAHKTPQVV